jgi:hypothetical protein
VPRFDGEPWFFVVGYCRRNPSQLDLTGRMVRYWHLNEPAASDAFLFDYPKLGHSGNFLSSGRNAFDVTQSSSNPPFVSALIAWIPLPANGVTACPTNPPIGSSSFPLKNGDGSTLTFTPVPVNTESNAADGYVVSAYDPAGNVTPTPVPQNKLAVWHLDSSGILHQDPDTPVNPYAFPPPATQSGGVTLDTLDGRLTQAVGDTSTGIWTQHTVSNGGVSKVTWYELTRSGSSLTLIQQGDVTGAAGEYIFNAAISPTSGAHGAAIFYNRSSATIHPLIAARSRVDTTPAGNMDPGELVLATSPATDADSSCTSQGGPPCRWGDYSGASPDPDQSDAVWGTNMFITAATSIPAWQDENFAVVIPPARGVAVRATPAPTRIGPNQAPPGTPGPR